jgi:hypothetical protein
VPTYVAAKAGAAATRADAATAVQRASRLTEELLRVGERATR